MEFFQDPITYVFGTTVTVEDRIKEIHTIMDSSIRDLKKEKMTLVREKKAAEKDLRIKAALGNKAPLKELKQLAIRCRRCQNQLFKIETTIDKISGFKSMATQLRTNEAQTRAFIKMTQAMTKMNEAQGAFKLCALMSQYENQNMILQQKQEFIDEKIEEMNEDSEEEEEAGNILDEVLDELHIKLTGDLPVAGKNNVVVVEQIEVEKKEESKKEAVAMGDDEEGLLRDRILKLNQKF